MEFMDLAMIISDKYVVLQALKDEATVVAWLLKQTIGLSRPPC
jgi:hypothetical protein